MAEQFRNSEEGFEAVRKKLLRILIPTMTVAVLGSFIINYFNPATQDAGSTHLVVVPVIAGVLIFIVIKAVKRQKELYNSFLITVTNNAITRQRLDTPSITIPFDEVSEIVSKGNGELTIRGKTAKEVIEVHPQLENMERFKALLGDIKPITARQYNSFSEKYKVFIGLLTVCLMIGTFASSNKMVVAICGGLLLPLLCYSFYDVQTNKNIDKKAKRGMRWILWIIVVIVFVMYMKFTNQF